eukprot:CAMPEP_0197891784 /NCGR_PEP_ID=MMETSP1439-20131203/29729_1 /TAXON_ID=66791 /ORGANISM="Gonyaulax spinifera, Strain CCMP409" /LENGTH=256 /DNA_ID=CAMNT_0043511915 /DNA_START=28 /DNA_END=795 /DNA_ORIENTATION=-
MSTVPLSGGRSVKAARSHDGCLREGDQEGKLDPGWAEDRGKVAVAHGLHDVIEVSCEHVLAVDGLHDHARLHTSFCRLAAGVVGVVGLVDELDDGTLPVLARVVLQDARGIPLDLQVDLRSLLGAARHGNVVHLFWLVFLRAQDIPVQGADLAAPHGHLENALAEGRLTPVHARSPRLGGVHCDELSTLLSWARWRTHEGALPAADQRQREAEEQESGRQPGPQRPPHRHNPRGRQAGEGKRGADGPWSTEASVLE